MGDTDDGEPEPESELSDAEISAFAALNEPLVEPEPLPGTQSDQPDGVEEDELVGVMAAGSEDSGEPAGDATGLGGLADGLRGMFKTANEVDERLMGLLQQVEEVYATDHFEEIQSLTTLIKATEAVEPKDS